MKKKVTEKNDAPEADQKIFETGFLPNGKNLRAGRKRDGGLQRQLIVSKSLISRIED